MLSGTSGHADSGLVNQGFGSFHVIDSTRKRLFFKFVTMFENLPASTALKLDRFEDVDHFHESERYANAESVPLRAGDFCVLRASLALPSCTLSLVRTFPRIINGYDFSGRLLIVIPMNGIASTRLNGKAVGQSLILVKGKANCTVVEPEGRLVAILSIRPEALDPRWSAFNGHMLMRLPPAELARLQMLICGALQLAATEPESLADVGVSSALEDSLSLGFDEAMYAGVFHDGDNPVSLARYKGIVDRVDRLLSLNPIDAANEKLADEIGVSVRTLQTASQSVCGMAIHRYTRLKRLWSVRRQLRTGATGLTVKASALAHGFWHISQFTNAYRESFGELPSATLAQARFGTGVVRLALNSR
jgi:AraC family ethanolamine operon transcriptional activator